MHLNTGARQLLWHPHQKLWNWDLLKRLDARPGGERLGRAVVHIDSLLLWARVLRRRMRRLGPRRLLHAGRLPATAVYLDCGLHKTGHQVRLVSEWFADRLDLTLVGIEASPVHYADACRALSDVPGADLRQLALVGPDHQEPTVRLFKARGRGKGKGDSLFAKRGREFDDVPAERLSTILTREGMVRPGVPVVLRMNIEGAEWFVIEDLVQAGLADRICGYYGMWDDMSKIDRKRDARFRRLLAENGIHTIAFNDRDLPHRLRTTAIRYDLTTSLVAGSRDSA
jgi:hypothetical protein